MSTSGSTAPMFSYAQAAKGLTPSIQNQSLTPSSASSDQGSKDTTIPSTESASVQTKPKALPSGPDGSADIKLTNGQPFMMQASNEDQTRFKGVTRELESTDASTTDTTSFVLGAEDEHRNLTNSDGPADANTKIPEQDIDKSNNTDDQDKSKEVDDDWEKVSVPSISATEKELKPAPIPVVNFWQQRREIQDAKLKEQATQRQVVVNSTPKPKAQTTPPREEGKRRQATKETGTEKDSATQRQPNSRARPSNTDRKDSSPSQLSPRSLSKQSEKSAPSFPATGDTESWPTPESVVVDDRRRSATQEKSEKPDTKAANQKKWIQMPFVPTAKFETQLPPAAAARRGGRAGNRGRDSNRGGNATSPSQAVEKGEVGSMGPPPAPKQAADQDRGRKGEASQSQRASSVPNHTRHSVSNGDGSINVRKVSEVATRDQVEINKVQSTTQRSTTGIADESSATDGSRSSSQQPAHIPSSTRNEDTDALQAAGTQGQTGFDRKGASRDGSRINNETAERPFPSGREWSRGRPESTREKSDSWRERREPRAERGRGAYRGRGGHASYNSHSQTFTAPLPQNGFESSKPFPNESRSRQASQPFAPSQPASGGRNNPRSQSIPLPVVQNPYYTQIPGFPQAMSPIQGEINYGNYSGQMPSGIMNAMPYADQLNSMALISMVITQLEYYFSINNLCKDLFLRKNMDSQGFVPLSVIAGFKRIQALTDGQMSHEQFRAVCQQAPHVEFVTTDNGEDKVRARGNWRDFILPVEERLSSAQNDGPNIHPRQRQHPAQVPHTFTGPSGTARSPPATLNGFSEPFTTGLQSMPHPSQFDGPAVDGFTSHAEAQTHQQGRRSSATSPFSQINSPPTHDLERKPSYMTNGHHRSASYIAPSENVFPDDKIAELKVVVRHPAFDINTTGSTNTAEAKASKLRGGAGSPQQRDQIKNIQFGQSSPDTDDDPTPFWTKHGQISKVPEGPSIIHEDYLSLRSQAFSQRDSEHYDGALAVLYPFWSTFLVENFNLSMYQEFASLAAEEAAAGGLNGQSHLLAFYDALLKRRTPVSERIAGDIVSMYREQQERGNKGPTFELLRGALRNGATDFKTLKRIMDILTPEEKASMGV